MLRQVRYRRTLRLGSTAAMRRGDMGSVLGGTVATAHQRAFTSRSRREVG